MRNYSLTHVRDEILLRDTSTLVAEEQGTMATVLAHLAEIDARKLYVPLGHSSMFAYCVQELRFSEDAAYKRIQAARIARQFPMLFTELAEGRLHLTAVCVLAPHLTPENVADIVRAAAHRRQSEIHDILRVCVAAGTGAQGELDPEPGTSGQLAVQQVEGAGDLTEGQLAAQQVGAPAISTDGQLAAQQVGNGSLLSQVEQLVPLMVRPEIKDQVRYLQALLSHAVPSGDVSDVLGRALALTIEYVEKRRFGTGNGSPRRRRTGARNRYIPADVRHAVWNRDEGRCTFVGTNGHRCDSVMHLEFDHVDPRNREDTAQGLRLRCRTHNQHEAERIFGTEFMERKREEARLAAERKREEKARAAEERERARAEKVRAEEEREKVRAEERERARVQAAANAELDGQIQDVLSALRGMGIRGDHARRLAERARSLEGATLPDRIRAALEFHGECIRQSPKPRRAAYA